MANGLPKDSKQENATPNQVLQMSKTEPTNPEETATEDSGNPKLETVTGEELKKGDKVLLGIQEHVVFEECTKKSFGSLRHAPSGRFAPFSYAGVYKKIL